MKYILLWMLPILVLALGMVEKQRHDRNIQKMKLRININGTRGKSTVTRLVTSIVKAAGYQVVGKTTGTSARILYWDRDEEEPIRRSRLGPNIIEQKHVIRKAVACGADAFVTECMAVNPDYQITFQDRLVRANVGVIVNVREDHMDLCGPTLSYIAESFTATIPYNGYLVAETSPFDEMFRTIARKRNSKVVITDKRNVPDNLMNRFGYVVFPENLSVAMGVAEALGIPEDVAINGMLAANPDPGALRVHGLTKERSFDLINAFAANDPNSTLQIWDHLKDRYHPNLKPNVILNCRPDRVDRTIQFAKDVLPHLAMNLLVTMGSNSKDVKDAVEAGHIKCSQYLDLIDLSPEAVLSSLDTMIEGNPVFCVGNIHGGGDELVELFIHEYSCLSGGLHAS